MQEFVRPKIFYSSSGKVASPNSLVADFDGNHRMNMQQIHLQMHEIHVLHQLIAINWNEKIN